MNNQFVKFVLDYINENITDISKKDYKMTIINILQNPALNIYLFNNYKNIFSKYDNSIIIQNKKNNNICGTEQNIKNSHKYLLTKYLITKNVNFKYIMLSGKSHLYDKDSIYFKILYKSMLLDKIINRLNDIEPDINLKNKNGEQTETELAVKMQAGWISVQDLLIEIDLNYEFQTGT